MNMMMIGLPKPRLILQALWLWTCCPQFSARKERMSSCREGAAAHAAQWSHPGIQGQSQSAFTAPKYVPIALFSMPLLLLYAFVHSSTSFDMFWSNPREKNNSCRLFLLNLEILAWNPKNNLIVGHSRPIFHGETSTQIHAKKSA